MVFAGDGEAEVVDVNEVAFVAVAEVTEDEMDVFGIVDFGLVGEAAAGAVPVFVMAGEGVGEFVGAEAVGVLLAALDAGAGVFFAEPGAAFGFDVGEGLGDGLRDFGGFVGSGRGEIVPGGAGEVEVAGFEFGVVEHGPPVFEEGEDEFGVGGELGEGLGAGEVFVFPFPTGEHVVVLAEVFAVFGEEGGGGFLIPNVEGLLGLVFDLFGAAEADALGVELDAGAGEDGGVVGEGAGGFEVFVELLGADEEDVADVGEAFAAAAVGLEFFGEAVVLAGEVADGVVVFEVGETAEGDGAGVAGVAVGDFGQGGVDPGDEGGFFGGEDFVGVFGGHFAGFDDLADFFPESEFLFDLGIGEEGLEVDAAFGFFVAMALEAGGI